MRIVLLCFLLIKMSLAKSEDMIYAPVIGNNSIESNTLTFEDVYSIFTLKKVLWPNSQPIKIILLPLNSQGHKEFLTKYIGIGTITYARRLKNAITSGRTDKPIYAKNNEEMLYKISTTVGAVGYLQGFVYVNTDGNILVFEVI